ncbi:unnamed protein product [Orchesella dallaii]|uniref:Uncharacterized protein n=1 Tax=Orchesella dallaii TaxID=48710 RepID=A0ABP1QP44_9HEXA
MNRVQKEKYELGMLGHCFRPVHYTIHRQFAREHARIQEFRDLDEEEREERRYQRHLNKEFVNAIAHITTNIEAHLQRVESQKRADKINASVTNCAKVWRSKARANLLKKFGETSKSAKIQAAIQKIKDCKQEEAAALEAFENARARRERAEEEYRTLLNKD